MLLNFLCRIKGEIISLRLPEYSGTIPRVIGTFLNENLDYGLSINTYLPFFISQFDMTKIIKENIIRNQTLHFESDYQSVLYHTDVRINNSITFLNLSIYFINQDVNIYGIDHGLALGYHIKDESFSILHQLYQKNIINHLQFSFKNFNEQLEHFFIGGVPNNEHFSLPYKATIKVDETLPTWGFTIDKLIFNGTEYDIGIPAIISSASENFWISDDLYLLFKDIILKNSIEKQLCQLVETSNIRYITCALSELDNRTSLIINNIKFTFSDEFFTQKKMNMIIVIASNCFNLKRKISEC